MPLRITVELIPGGDESHKVKLAEVNIESDGKVDDPGAGEEVENYRVRAAGHCKGGFDDFAAFTIGPLKRRENLDTAIECLLALHSSKLPPGGFIEGTVRVGYLDRKGRWDANPLKSNWQIRSAARNRGYFNPSPPCLSRH